MKAGDYVLVCENVWDESMPRNRKDGLILDVLGDKNDQVLIIFSNGQILKFHKSQIEVLAKS